MQQLAQCYPLCRAALVGGSTKPPQIALYDDTILEPGMVFTLEPGVVNDLETFLAEEDIVVRTDGYWLLAITPRELYKI